jgi:hypothetical protein
MMMASTDKTAIIIGTGRWPGTANPGGSFQEREISSGRSSPGVKQSADNRFTPQLQEEKTLTISQEILKGIMER